MDRGCVNIIFHHNGAFSKEGAFTYDGGKVSIIRDIDKDLMSYFHVVELAKTVGFHDGDSLYYAIPGRSLEYGIDLLKDDASVSEMMKHATETNFLEIYIQPNNYVVGGHQKFGSGTQHATSSEINNNGAKKKLNKRRDKRIWTAEEEKVLVDILYEMNGSGWKVDTGHKSGYLLYIEKELAKRLTNANIKADPHIASKVKILKKQLSCILDIQQFGSGFGWDDEKKMIVGDKDQFMGWAKSRPGAAALYGKPIPNYDRLYEIYANDLAKGAMATGPGDQLELNEEPCTINLMETPKEVQDESHSQTPCTGSNPSNGSKHGGGRKRALLEDEQFESSFGSVLKSLQSLVEVKKENAAVMNDIKAALLHEVEVKKKIEAQSDLLLPTLCALPGFTDDEIVKAAFIIGKDAQALGLFFRAPDDKKFAAVRNALASDET